jgi:hypothetical protein
VARIFFQVVAVFKDSGSDSGESLTGLLTAVSGVVGCGADEGAAVPECSGADVAVSDALGLAVPATGPVGADTGGLSGSSSMAESTWRAAR